MLQGPLKPVLSAATGFSIFTNRKHDVAFVCQEWRLSFKIPLETCQNEEIYRTACYADIVQTIIPEVSRSFLAQNATSLANRIGDWWMTDRPAAAKVPIESCTKSYQHMRACTTALRIDPNMWRVRCFFSTAELIYGPINMFKLWSARKTSLCTDYYDGKKIAAMNAIHITWSYWRVNLYSSCFHIAVFRKSKNQNFGI